MAMVNKSNPPPLPPKMKRPFDKGDAIRKGKPLTAEKGGLGKQSLINECEEIRDLKLDENGEMVEKTGNNVVKIRVDSGEYGARDYRLRSTAKSSKAVRININCEDVNLTEPHVDFIIHHKPCKSVVQISDETDTESKDLFKTDAMLQTQLADQTSPTSPLRAPPLPAKKKHLRFKDSESVSGDHSPDSGNSSDLERISPPLQWTKDPKPSSMVKLLGNGYQKGGNWDHNSEDEDQSYDSLNSCESGSAEDRFQNKVNEKLTMSDRSAGSGPGYLFSLLSNRQNRAYDTGVEPRNDMNNGNGMESRNGQDIPIVRNSAEVGVNSPENGLRNQKRSSVSSHGSSASPSDSEGIAESVSSDHFDADKYYSFHLNENDFGKNPNKHQKESGEQTDYFDSFAGCKTFSDYNPDSPTIKSSKGTIRGVKNRVRAGIATFLQIPANKNWAEKEAGKVVVYTTSMGIVRETYERCLKVRQILWTHLVKFDERDIFRSRETQAEIKERMNCKDILVPQVFIEGQHIGDAETIDRLNESGELRTILKPYRSPDACSPCQVCGGYQLLPCALCSGSKKSVHQNQFMSEVISLKCVYCDEVGLVKCYAC